MPERRSALESPDPPTGKREGRPLVIGEVRGFALLQAAAFVGTLAALERAVRSTLGVDLPKRIDAPRRANGICVFKTGLEQFLLVGPEDAQVASTARASLESSSNPAPLLAEDTRLCKVGPEQVRPAGAKDFWADTLRDAVPPAMGSLTSLSHGRTRLFLEGAAAREVLSTGIAVDLHPEVFRCDAYALTGLQDTPVLLHRTGAQRYELYVLRTYAGWIWDWLADAAKPFGYEVVEKSHTSLLVGSDVQA